MIKWTFGILQVISLIAYASTFEGDARFKSNHRMCSIKITVLKIFTIFTGKRLCWSLFLVKLQAFRCFPNVSLWILRGFKEHLFWKTSANGCFCCLFNVRALKQRAIIQLFQFSFGAHWRTKLQNGENLFKLLQHLQKLDGKF